MKRKPQGKNFDAVCKDGAEYAASLGLPTTGEIPGRGVKPEFDLPKVPVADLPPAIERLTKEQKLEVIANYLDLCEQLNTGLRQKHYKGLAPQKGWPTDSNLGEGMVNWTHWVAAADEWGQTERKKAAYTRSLCRPMRTLP